MMKKYNIFFNTNYYVIRILLYFKYEKISKLDFVTYFLLCHLLRNLHKECLKLVGQKILN